MNKKRKGVTLVELILAISLLTFATTPIIAVMISSFRTSAQAQEMKSASFAAQQAMEGLMGRPWNGPAPAPALAHFGWGYPQSINTSGRTFWYVASAHLAQWGPYSDNPAYGRTLLNGPLIQVTISVYATFNDATGPPQADRTTANHITGVPPAGAIATHTTWINTAPGGFNP